MHSSESFRQGLKVLTILSQDAEINKHAFMNCKDIEKLIVPEGSGKYYRTILADARIPVEVVEMNFEEENSISENQDNKEEILTNKKEEIMEKLNFPGYSTLVLSGKGYVIEGVGDENVAFFAVFVNPKVEFNGEEVTDKVKKADIPQFLSGKFFKWVENAIFYYGDNEIELPKSIFLMPEGTKIDDIELIPINRDFRDWDKGGIVADFIFFEGKELIAQSFRNNIEGLPVLPPFDYEGIKFNHNDHFYNNYYEEENQTTGY